MKNLIKYEVIRMKWGLLISLAALGILEAAFLVSTAIDALTVMGFAVVFMAMGVIFLIIGIAVEILNQYSKDLNDKSGYMIFMTPNSYYKIIGSKLLTSMILVLGLGIIMLLVASLDGVVAAIHFNDTLEFDIAGLLREMNIYIETEGGAQIIGGFLTGFFGWVSFFTPIFFVMTLNRVYFANWKGRSLISVVLYIAIMLCYSWIEDKILSVVYVHEPGLTTLTVGVLTAVLAVGCYFGTVKVLEKKLSL